MKYPNMYLVSRITPRDYGEDSIFNNLFSTREAAEKYVESFGYVVADKNKWRFVTEARKEGEYNTFYRIETLVLDSME